MIEKWIPVKGYEDHYEVSNLGQVRNIPRVVLMSCRGGKYVSRSSVNKPTNNNKGYGRVFLCKYNKTTTKYVHRLVAENWCANPMNYKEVNHIDGNKANNAAQNLEWVSRRQNCVHARVNGLFIPAPSKLTARNIDDIILMRKNGLGRKDVADKYGINVATVSCITSGKIWSWYTGIGQREGLCLDR